MNSEFYKHILGKQQGSEAVPSNGSITGWVEKLICILFPEKSECSFSTLEEIEEQFKKLEKELNHLLDTTKACSKDDNRKKAKQFFEQLPELYRILNTDVEALLEGDPAARNRFEVIRAYPGFYAICFYRIAHALLKMNTPLLPRIITEQAHSKTGIDIHPAADIDEYFFIDHGTGIVIGETCNIGHHVKLYQGVTLGALSVDKSMASTKRHPTVEDYVIIYSGATILGGTTIIGHHSIIGGNVWLTKSVAPYSTVYHKGDIEVIEQTTI